MHLVSTRVGNVAVDISGEGPPLVLLHAVAHDHHDYDAVVPTLSKAFRTIAVDWPGHGASDMWEPPRSAGVARTCDVLDDVAAALELPPAVIMGNSVGGTAAIRFAARHPDRVRGLVLVDGGAFPGSAPLLRSLFCGVQGRAIVRRATGMAFARWYLKTPGPHVDALLARLASARARPGFVAMDAAMWRSFGTAENDLTELAPAVKCPTLVVWGKRDPVLRASAEGTRTRELLPHARYVEIDAGHVPFVEKPHVFLDAVLPFLESIRSLDERARAERRFQAAAESR